MQIQVSTGGGESDRCCLSAPETYANAVGLFREFLGPDEFGPDPEDVSELRRQLRSLAVACSVVREESARTHSRVQREDSSVTFIRIRWQEAWGDRLGGVLEDVYTLDEAEGIFPDYALTGSPAGASSSRIQTPPWLG